MEFYFHKFENINDRYLVKKIEEFNGENLKKLFLVLGFSDVSFRNKYEGIDAFLELSTSFSKKCEAIYEVEMSIPSSHGFLGTFESEINLNTVFKKFKTPLSAKSKINTLKSLKLVHVQNFEHEGETRFLFEHSFKYQWNKPLSSTKFEKTIVERLHSVVVTFLIKEKVFFVNYQGFTQGIGLEAGYKISYREIVGAVLDVFRNTFELDIKTLFLKEGINSILDRDLKNLHITRASPSQDKGRMTLVSNLENKSVQQWLAGLINKHLEEVELERLEDAIATAIKEDCRCDSYVVTWVYRNQPITVRIDFWTEGPEFYFTWGKTKRSRESIIEFCEQMISLGKISNSDSLKNCWVHLLDQPKGSILVSSNITEKFAVGINDYKEIITEALRLNLVEPVYNIDFGFSVPSEKVEWVADPKVLFRKYDTSDGFVDGTDPENLLVAFRRK